MKTRVRPVARAAVAFIALGGLSFSALPLAQAEDKTTTEAQTAAPSVDVSPSVASSSAEVTPTASPSSSATPKAAVTPKSLVAPAAPAAAGTGTATGKVVPDGSDGFTTMVTVYADGNMPPVAFHEANADGTFTIADLPVGDYKFAFQAPGRSLYTIWNGGATSLASAPLVTIGAGETVDLGTVDLRPNSHVTGVAKLAKGATAERGIVRFISTDGNVSKDGYGYLREDGTYTADLYPGTYKANLTLPPIPVTQAGPGSPVVSLWFGGTDEASATALTITDGQTREGADFQLPALGTLSGKVIGLPAGARATVFIDPTGFGLMSAPYQYGLSPVAADGTYSISRVPAGVTKVFLVVFNNGRTEYWYGGGTSWATAPGLTFAPGQDMTGINFDLNAKPEVTPTTTTPIPTPTTAAPAPVVTATATAVSGGSELPNTGSNPGLIWVAVAGLGMVGAGTASVMAARRRRSH